MTTETEEIHAAKVAVVQKAVVGLLPKFADQGMTATAIAEGAIKAAAVVMLADRGASLDDVAGILEDFAKALRADGGGEIARH